VSDSALRLWFAFDGAKVQLTRFWALSTSAPPSMPLGEGQPLEGVTGAWIELRDPDGRCLWRRILHDPFQTRIEGRAEGGGFTNAYRNHPRGSLVVLVPDLPHARTVALFGSPLERERRHEAAREVAAFDLRGRR